MVTCWESADLLALVGDDCCIFVTFQCGFLGSGVVLIVSFPDLCRLPYFEHITFSPFMIMESSLTIDDMINNPNLLLSAVNETIASDTTQQYYTPQTPSTYIPHPV